MPVLRLLIKMNAVSFPGTERMSFCNTGLLFLKQHFGAIKKICNFNLIRRVRIRPTLKGTLCAGKPALG